MGSVFPVSLLTINSLRKDPYWAAALSSAPTPSSWNGAQAGECILVRWKQEPVVMPKSVHGLISIASRPAVGTPGSLNKARLWQWNGESTPEEIRQTTDCAVAIMSWDSAFGVHVWCKFSFVSRCLDETVHYAACDYPIHTWWQAAWWASAFVCLLKRKS